MTRKMLSLIGKEVTLLYDYLDTIQKLGEDKLSISEFSHENLSAGTVVTCISEPYYCPGGKEIDVLTKDGKFVEIKLKYLQVDPKSAFSSPPKPSPHVKDVLKGLTLVGKRLEKIKDNDCSTKESEWYNGGIDKALSIIEERKKELSDDWVRRAGKWVNIKEENKTAKKKPRKKK